jgi:hypothetical protein
MITDFSTGRAPAQVRYLESWGESPRLDGWHDANDLQFVGDFLGLGRQQVMFINRSGTAGRVMITDFSTGRAPAQVRYLESWGDSFVLDGWHDADDLPLVGDFAGLGSQQVMFVNRSPSFP